MTKYKTRKIYEDGSYLEITFTWFEEMIGIGKYVSPDYNIYQGDFQNLTYHGKGKLFKKNGYTYEGEFKDGNYEGLGAQKLQIDTRDEGGFFWTHVKDNNQYRSYYNLIAFYEGCWNSSHLEGPTYMYDSNRLVYWGNYKNSKRNGKGMTMLLNGCRALGENRDGSLNGVNTFTDLEGNERKGIWKESELVRWIDDND